MAVLIIERERVLTQNLKMAETTVTVNLPIWKPVITNLVLSMEVGCRGQHGAIVLCHVTVDLTLEIGHVPTQFHNMGEKHVAVMTLTLMSVTLNHVLSMVIGDRGQNGVGVHFRAAKGLNKEIELVLTQSQILEGWTVWEMPQMLLRVIHILVLLTEIGLHGLRGHRVHLLVAEAISLEIDPVPIPLLSLEENHV